MASFKECTCKLSGVVWKQYNSLQKCQCDECRSKRVVKPNLKLKSLYKIPKVSEKRKALKIPYEIVRSEVLSEAKFKCFVKGCNNVANTIEHQRGHSGFFDDWARDNNISLHIDKRFLKACCFFHNQEFENNPELSKEYQLSKIHKGSK